MPQDEAVGEWEAEAQGDTVLDSVPDKVAQPLLLPDTDALPDALGAPLKDPEGDSEALTVTELAGVALTEGQ